MIQIDNSIVKEVVTHFVGRKSQEEGVTLSQSPVSQTEALRHVLKNSFLSPFDSEENFHFDHEAGCAYNFIYSLCCDIFDNLECILEKSRQMASYLYDKSEHQKIKAGEFYVVLFHDVMLDGDSFDAIGLFKSEQKDKFLKVVNLGSMLNMEAEEGISTHKLDKGALVFAKNREDGFVVKIVDGVGKTDAQYWRDDFLGVESNSDEYTNTKHAMAMAKNFVVKELPKNYEISKDEQITLLGKTLEYFQGNEEFSMESFGEEVFGDMEVTENLVRFKEQYEAKNDITIEDSFGISAPACERQQRVYKRVIKLDDNIRIYISGSRENVLQGEDEYGKFYKVYYENESI